MESLYINHGSGSSSSVPFTSQLSQRRPNQCEMKNENWDLYISYVSHRLELKRNMGRNKTSLEFPHSI